MRIYLRGKKWWVAWTEKGVTRRESTGCTTKEAAVLFAKRLERDLADPDHAAKKAARFAVESEIFLNSVRARKNVPAGTVNMYECKVGHLNRLMPEMMAKVDVKAVDEYFLTRKSEGSSGSTLHKEWVALRGVLKTAGRRGHWSGNLDFLKPDWISAASEERKRRLTWDELWKLLAQLDEEMGDIVRYAVATGARRSELMRAREGDADGLTMAIRIRGTKTAGSDKAIPIPPMFRHLLPQRAWLVRCAPINDAPKLMFPRMPEDPRVMNSACKRAGIQPVTYNDLRRTFASLIIDAGVANTVAAKLLRHTTTAMVDRHYGKMQDSALAALVESMGDLKTVSGLYQNGENGGVGMERKEEKHREIASITQIEDVVGGHRVRSTQDDTLGKSQKPVVAVRRLYQRPTIHRLVPMPCEVARAWGRAK